MFPGALTFICVGIGVARSIIEILYHKVSSTLRAVTTTLRKTHKRLLVVAAENALRTGTLYAKCPITTVLTLGQVG